MMSDATDLDARLAQVEAEMAKSDPRYVSEAVREIVTLGRAVLALVYKPDPQDCPTCRALIEATMRELDKPEPPERAEPVEPNVQALQAAVRALERDSTSPEMLRANVDYLYDRYVLHPVGRTPGGTDD